MLHACYQHMLPGYEHAPPFVQDVWQMVKERDIRTYVPTLNLDKVLTTYNCIFLHRYVRTYIHTHTDIKTYKYVGPHGHKRHTYVRKYTLIYTAQTHTHTYTQTNTQTGRHLDTHKTYTTL